MTAAHIAKMRAGAKRAKAARDRASIRRVHAFDAWLAETHGQSAACQFRALAAIQADLGVVTDHDFRVARGES